MKILRRRRKNHVNVFWSRLEVLILIVIYASKEIQRSEQNAHTHLYISAHVAVQNIYSKCHSQKRKWHKMPNSCWLSVSLMHRFIGFTLVLFPFLVVYHFCLMEIDKLKYDATKRKHRTHAVIVHGSMRSKWLKINIMSGLLD